MTRLDHDANIRPWVQAAERGGRDGALGRVRPGDRRADGRRRPGRAVRAHQGWSRSPAPRTCSAPGPTCRRSPRRCTRSGALLYVDGVHLTPHAPVDVAALGADFFACSPYKFFGPHHGVVVAAPELLERLAPGQAAAVHATRCRSGSSSARCPTSCSPARPPRSTTSPASRSDAADRRTRVLESMRAVEEYEDRLFDRLLDGLRGDRRRHAARRARRGARRRCSSRSTVARDRRGLRAPGDGRRQRTGQQLLRDRGVAVARPRRHRCGARRAGAVHQRRRRRPAGRRRRGAARGAAFVS